MTMEQVAPFCPNCLGKRVPLWHEGQEWSRTSYQGQTLVHRWKCLDCGTVVVAMIPVTIYRPEPQEGSQK